MQSSSNFTVEQVELIRRLRNSGITQQQIIEAFQSYERLEEELGGLYSCPINRNNQSLKHLNSRLSESCCPSNQVLDTAKACPIKTNNSNSTINGATSQDSVHQFKSEIAKPPTDKYIMFLLSQGKENLLELMRRCHLLTLSDLKQHVMELGVGEMSLYFFLSGELHSIEPNTRYKLLEWLVEKLKQTDWFVEEFPQLCNYQDCAEGLDVHFIPRRERFTFKEKHLEILEKFFKKGQYPTQEEKEFIANECNIAMATEVNRDLGEKECMSHINVSNWFSNRRKEIKRLAKKDGIEAEKVVLPSRVKAKGQIYSSPLEEQCLSSIVGTPLVQIESLSETDSRDSFVHQPCQNETSVQLESTFSFTAPNKQFNESLLYISKHLNEKSLSTSFNGAFTKTCITVKTEPAE